MLTILTLILLLLAWWLPAHAAQVTLMWGTSPDADGYALHYGLESGLYTTALDTGPLTSAAISGLSVGVPYFFGAVAYNEGGTSGYSNEVQYTVPVSDTLPPTVSITDPDHGDRVQRNSTVTIRASASDHVGVTRVEFTVNGQAVCPADTSSPYRCTWHVPSPRNVAYDLQAIARDAAGNVGLSAMIRVTSR